MAAYRSDGGVWRVKCHGCGFGGDIFDVRAKWTGATLDDTLREHARSSNGVAPRQPAWEYDYFGADGAVLHQTVRFRGEKAFRQRRPDGDGGWVWNLKGTQPVLYRLPQLLAAPEGEIIFIGEGEKDCDRLVAAGLLATTCPMGAGKWRLVDDSVLHGRDVVVLSDADAAGRSHAEDVAARLTLTAKRVRVVDLGPGRDDGFDVSDWLDEGHAIDELVRLVDAADEWHVGVGDEPLGRDQRPPILIDHEEHRVVDEVVAALAADEDLYQRGPMLVRVQRDAQIRDGVRRFGTPVIAPLPVASLREKMTRFAAFFRSTKDGPNPAHPTQWAVNAVAGRGEWQDIRPLQSVSDAPVLRPDGSIWQTPGYDAVTGVLYQPETDFPAIPSSATKADAIRAAENLYEVICDFHFESDAHRSVWLAALLTPIARFAFSGPAPLFLFDANVRGAGKTLLIQTIGRIVRGHDVPVSSYAHDEEEMRKKITAIAISGDQMVLLDNLNGVLGNGALDRALTSVRWRDRVLGKSEQVDLPLLTVWYATGNNTSVMADTDRRLVYARLDVLEERPEERSDFRHPNLLTWIEEHRGRLLAGALTTVAAYVQAGKPSQDLTPFGSFEGWSDLVRSAIVWAGLPDPCETRAALTERVDASTAILGQLIDAWKLYGPGTSFVLSDLVRQLFPESGPAPSGEADRAMRAAIENFDGPGGKSVTARRLGRKLSGYRRRVHDGAYIDCDPAEKQSGGALWRLHQVTPGSPR